LDGTIKIHITHQFLGAVLLYSIDADVNHCGSRLDPGTVNRSGLANGCHQNVRLMTFLIKISSSGM